MKNLKCAFHPAQQLINFCRNQQCMLPMCPNCIKIHSSQHQLENTHGIFQNINEIYNQIETNLHTVLKNLVNCSENLQKVILEKEQRRQILKIKMKQMRIKMIDNINKYIDQIEKQIISNLGGKQSDLQQDFIRIDDKIKRISKQVNKEILLISGQKVLKGIINHLSYDLFNNYNQQIGALTSQIQDIDQKDITICKQFRVKEMSCIFQKIHQCYRTTFIGSIKKINRRLDSKISIHSKNSQENFY